ncbi:DUF4234 domain-containing protein [bacterium]|nr:DUF4234 domain-containing protein [bacterium]
MAKFCTNCGKELKEEAVFCEYCGSKVNDSINSINSSNNRPMISKRDVAMAIILSIITCGLYGIYWFIVMTDESNNVSDEKTSSGGLAFLYTLVTCGIYRLYWNYKMGQKLYLAGKKYNLPISDNSVLYLILTIFGLDIVNYCLIQSDLNRFAD